MKKQIGWGIVTILLAVTGAIGLFNEIARLIRGGEIDVVTVAKVLLAILFLVLAPRAYAKAKMG